MRANSETALSRPTGARGEPGYNKPSDRTDETYFAALAHVQLSLTDPAAHLLAR